jgi:apolipoprotein N-acyltransferase
LIFGSNKSGFLQQEQKRRLIAGGEYLSFSAEVLMKDFAKATYDDFLVRRAVVKGKDQPKIFTVDSHLILGSAACSGIISTEDYRKLVSQGATVLTNSASLEIFRGSRLFNWEHRGLAKFMAVANARPFLQSSNNWPAFAIDQNGNQFAQIQPVNSTQVLVKTNNPKTLYSKIGEWPVLVGAAMIVYDIWFKYRPKSTGKGEHNR